MKSYLYLLALLMSINSFGQIDTTSNRLITISDAAELNIYTNDTAFYYLNFSVQASSGHAIFMNPNDHLLYAIVDVSGGDRNLYKINPFTGDLILVHDFMATYIHTADIGNNNIIYGVVGNAGAIPGEVISLNLNTMVESSIYTSASGLSGSPRGIEFNTSDSSLYIYEAYADNLYIYDLATGIESLVTTTGLNSVEMHGGFYDEDADHMLITEYGGVLFQTDASYLNSSIITSDLESGTMDIAEFKLLDTNTDSIALCFGDSVEISLLYTDSITWVWYHDGMLMSNTNGTLWANGAGEYQALIKKSENGANYHFWSETFLISELPTPMVTITEPSNDTLICLGETITLNGVNGGSLQWFKDGVALSGATSNSLVVTSPGSYNQEKTNLSGCLGTAAIPYIIYNCVPTGLNDIRNTIEVIIYPNPFTNEITVKSDESISQITVTNLFGQNLVVIQGDGSSIQTINLDKYPAGIYFIKLQVGDKETVKKITKK